MEHRARSVFGALVVRLFDFILLYSRIPKLGLELFMSQRLNETQPTLIFF